MLERPMQKLSGTHSKTIQYKRQGLFQTQGVDFPSSSATRALSGPETDAGSTTMEVDTEGAIDVADLFVSHAVSNAAENQRCLKRHYQVRHLIASQSVRITG